MVSTLRVDRRVRPDQRLGRRFENMMGMGWMMGMILFVVAADQAVKVGPRAEVKEQAYFETGRP